MRAERVKYSRAQVSITMEMGLTWLKWRRRASDIILLEDILFNIESDT